MISPDPPQELASKCIEAVCSSPTRISFSADCPEKDTDFISINLLLSNKVKKEEESIRDPKACNLDFEFLSNDGSGPDMITADELFYEGKLLTFWQMHHSEKLKKMSLKTREAGEDAAKELESNNRSVGNWFVDDDPSPRPPNCTVLWKELLRLKKKKKKQRASSLSSSSSSSTSSLHKSSENAGNKSNKGLERTKPATITRIRPMLNVPICETQGGRITTLPPLFPLRKVRLDW